LLGTYRPIVGVGAPIFISNGARYGARAEGGLEWIMNRHLALILAVGVEHNFNPEMGKAGTLFVPGAGIAGRL
jgi:hypothetical protein